MTDQAAHPMAGAFETAMDALTGPERYKLLCGVVVPRPIALVTTLGAGGVTNAAPFSFFNVFSETPPLVILGLQANPDGSHKDTTRNVRDNGEFVVNLVDEALGEAMNDCAVDFPPEIGEPKMVGLAITASTAVAPGRIARAPFALECRRHTILSFGPGRELLVGEVLHLHAAPGLIDRKTLRVDVERYHPLGRLFGNLYARQKDRLTLERRSYAQFGSDDL